MRKEVRLAGTGGQGLITAAILLAEAAGLHEGRHVVQTQAYGPEARGGASRADVIVSDAPIHYPKATHPDILVALSQAACDLYAKELKRGGVLIVDADLVPTRPAIPVVALPLTRIVREALGKETFTNVAALGVLCGVTKLVGEEALRQAVADKVPPHTLDANLKAFAIGLEAGRAASPVAVDEVGEEDF